MARISVIVRIEVKPDRVDEFPSAWTSVVEHVRANEPDTEHYMLHRARDRPNVFYVTEVYKDQAAFDAHIGGDAVAQLFNGLEDHIIGLDMDMSEPILSARV
jgi:autoinducer 2-degrading protein